MPVGHNSGQLTEDERKSLFFSHVRKRMAIDAKIKTLRTERKEDGAAAQSFGIVLKDMDFAIEAMQADDKAKISDRYLSHGEILNWLGLVTGFQADLLRDRAPALDRIENDGQVAGLAGKSEGQSGYPAKSDEDTAWRKGHREGQRIMRDNLKAAMDKKNAENKATVEGLKGDKPKPEPKKTGKVVPMRPKSTKPPTPPPAA
jgi:ribosome modulation factor